MSYKYILNGKQPVPCDDVIEWGGWMENNEIRRVALDEINGIRISTVFLGIDHDFTGRGPPILFETMIFGGGPGFDHHQERYRTWDEAAHGHLLAVETVKTLNALGEK